MKQHGKGKLLNASDWPSFVETVRPIYEDFELTKLFRACAFPRKCVSSFISCQASVTPKVASSPGAMWISSTWRSRDRETALGFQPKNWKRGRSRSRRS